MAGARSCTSGLTYAAVLLSLSLLRLVLLRLTPGPFMQGAWK